jgi:hypothetical protein
MGITIHYRGALRDPHQLPELIDTAKLFCDAHGWKFVDVDDRVIGKADRYTFVKQKNDDLPGTDGTDVFTETTIVPVDDHIRGIIINPPGKCEPVWLTFNEAGQMQFYWGLDTPGRYWEQTYFSTKTQYASLDTHVAVCELLRIVKTRFMPELKVTDEGEYFETEDFARLKENMEHLAALMDAFGKALKGETEDLPPEMKEKMQQARKAVEKSLGTKEKKKKLKFERAKEIRVKQPEWTRGRGRTAGRN